MLANASLSGKFQSKTPKFLGQQMGKLSRKARFIYLVECNSAVKPDALISVLFEINAPNINALLLAMATIIKADLT